MKVMLKYLKNGSREEKKLKFIREPGGGILGHPK